MAKTSWRGHPAFWDGTVWRYSDNYKPVTNKRTCARCGKRPTKEGYDACLGFIPGVLFACCGHGVGRGQRVCDVAYGA